MVETRKPNHPAGRRPGTQSTGKLAKGAAARRAAEKKRRQRTVAYTSMVVLAVAALVAVIVLNQERGTAKAVKRPDEAALTQARAAARCTEVRQFPQASSGDHITAAQQPKDWNSNPPTSGQHLAVPLPRGWQAAQQDERALVHNLEHGYVAIQYKNLPAKQVDQLKAFAEDHANEKLVVMPYNGLDKDGMTLTAWTYLQTCASYNEDVVKAFVADYMLPQGSKSRAPEPYAQ
jgi:hypothetical protein